MNRFSIESKLQINGISGAEDLAPKLGIYLELLKLWNEKMDLTADTDDDEMIDRHFIDSLAALKTSFVKEGTEWIDVGTGAGFPGMVLALARPDIKMVLMDAQQKRLDFLEEVIHKTSAQNVRLIHSRAEDGARKKELREKFDFAVARAVAPLNILCEYLLPYVRKNGYALCWKGPALCNEIEAGSAAARMLGGKVAEPVSCHVAGREWNHMILPIRKVEETALIYPRKAGMPKQKPLGGKHRVTDE